MGGTGTGDGGGGGGGGTPGTPAAATPATAAAPAAPGPVAEHNVGGKAKTLYTDAQDALKAVRDDYLYWTERLSDTSVKLSYAVLAANWAVFGTVDQIATNFWSRASVLLVVLSLSFSLVGAKLMSEKHLGRINYAESHQTEWQRDFDATAGKRDPYPFTAEIEKLGDALRFARTWLPLAAGVAFFVALLPQ